MTATVTNIDDRRVPAGSVADQDGHFYPIDGDNYWSVTSALSIMSKEGLVRWSAGLAADTAFAELPKLVHASRRPACGNTYNRCRGKEHDWQQRCPRCPCDTCKACVRKLMANKHYGEKGRRADEGSRVHSVIEHWILNDGHILAHDPDVAPYVKQFRRFVADHGLVPDSWLMAEGIVVNREHRYAGTLDGIVVVHADAGNLATELVAMVLGLPKSQVAGRSVTLIVDFKTREGDEARLYDEMPLQLAAYRGCPVVRIRRTGQEEPLPEVDGALLVQLLPEDYHRQPVVADELEFAAFLNALSLFRWRVEAAGRAISRRTFAVPAEPKPTKTTAPRKTAAKRAAPAKKTTAAAKTTRPAVTAQRERSLAERVLGLPNPHPDSPYGDEIPF